MTIRNPGSRFPTGPNRELPSTAEVAALALQHAIDAVVWGTPIVSFDAMRQAFFRDAGARYNDIVYWSQVADASLQITTPNASSRYVYLNFNTADGPLLFEVPPATGAGLFGSILDAWQVPLVDVGPHGEDVGRGGSYLLLPPDDRGTQVEDMIGVPMRTYNGYIVLRAIPENGSPEAVERALALVKKLRIYPARRDVPPRQRFIDMAGKPFEGIVRFDDTFFDSLARMIGEEPVQPHDLDQMHQLEMLGIEKGLPLRADLGTRHLLSDAARAAHGTYMRASAEYGGVYWRGRNWRWPSTVGAKTGFTFLTERGLDVADRGLTYFLACAPPAKLGKATAYLGAYVDADGRVLAGERTYRLHVPSHVPAKQFWAATVYDASTAAFMRRSPRVELNSYADLEKNPDGSIDLYFGPKPPEGKERNWAYTERGEAWFLFFRFYGPTEALFGGSWQLPDLQVVDEPVVHMRDGHGWIATETVHGRVGALEFEHGFPTAAAIGMLREQRLFQRAVEVYLAHIPAASMFHVHRGLVEAGVTAANKAVVWDRLMDSQTLLLTGNTETVYALTMLDLRRDGPTVVEIPAGVLGGSCDMWQRNLVDLGPPGPDRGQGGRYLFVPPDHQGRVPEGYYIVPSRTYGVFVGLRGFLVDGKPDQPAALLSRMRIYPLARAASPPAMEIIAGSGKPIDTIFTDNDELYEDLAELVQREPADAVDPGDRYFLAELGIEKGRPFAPDTGTRVVLAEAARVGAAMARVDAFASRDPARIVYPDRHWEWVIVGGNLAFDSQGYVEVDRRAAFYYTAIGSSPAMAMKIVGAGSQYLWTPRDATGAYLDGGRHYRLRLPPRIPVAKFWSVVVYDAISRSELQTEQRLPSVSLYTNPAINPDGSIEIFFGPTPPSGKERNWIQTVHGKGWFPYLRFYSPTQAFFDRTWKPDDIVPEGKAA